MFSLVGEFWVFGILDFVEGIKIFFFFFAEKLGNIKGELKEAEDAMVKALSGNSIFLFLFFLLTYVAQVSFLDVIIRELVVGYATLVGFLFVPKSYKIGIVL